MSDNIIHDVFGNSHYGRRYIKFISNMKPKGGEYSERHHILPASLFPEFSNLSEHPWNSIVVSGRQHYILHYVLAKIFGSKMWFAFNQMRRIVKENGKKSVLYAVARENIAKEISKANRGKVRSEEQRLQMSLDRTGKLHARDEYGVVRRMPISEYNPSIHTHIALGRTHTDDTKKLISMNGIRGLFAYSNEYGDVSYFKTDEIAFSNGFKIKGNKKLIGRVTTFSGKSWVTDGQGNSVRISLDEVNVGEYTIGRIFNNRGFDKINDGTRVTVFDTVKCSFENIMLVDFDNSRHLNHGGSTTMMIILRGVVVIPSNKARILEIIGFNPFPDRIKSNLSETPISKHAKTSEKRKFYALNKDKTYGELGFVAISVAEYMNAGYSLPIANSNNDTVNEVFCDIR